MDMSPEVCEQCQRVIYLEQQARLVHERLRTILDHATCGIMMVDAEARILYANRYVCNVLGYNWPELDQRSAFDFVHPQEMRLRHLLFEKTLEQPGKLKDRGYARFRSKAGLWVLLGLRVINLIDDPNVGVIIVYVSDESAQFDRYNAGYG